MQVKPSITKSLKERRVVLAKRADDNRAKLTVMETETVKLRAAIAEDEAEIEDIKEFLNQPTEE